MASDRLPVHVPQASSGPGASADTSFRLASYPCKLLPSGEPQSAQLGEALGNNGGFDSGAARTGISSSFTSAGFAASALELE